jgi:hypothetical protein
MDNASNIGLMVGQGEKEKESSIHQKIIHRQIVFINQAFFLPFPLLFTIDL